MTKAEIIVRTGNKLKEMKKEKPWITVSLGIAQVGRESGWGKHAPGNNFLGIKVPLDKNGNPSPTFPKDRMQLLWTTEFVNGIWKRVKCWFVKYDSFEHCIERYVKILELDRYKQTRESKDFYDATNYVRLNGYATSPYYTDGLRTDIMQNKLYTWDYARDPKMEMSKNFLWEETFSGVVVNGKYYYRIIEPYPAYWLNAKHVIQNLQILRNHYGKPFVVTSFFRTPSYNVMVKGASQSQHLTANAADIRLIRGITHATMQKDALDYTKFLGFGVARTFMHFDLRKKFAKWFY
jgi:hypothetical protein